MDADAAAETLLGRSWSDVEAAAADYIAAGEAEVVRWTWSGPRAHLWEEHEPVVGNEEPFRLMAQDPAPERRRDFARFGHDDEERIVVAQRFADRTTPDGERLGVLEIACVWVGDVFVRFAHDPWRAEPDALELVTIGRNVPDSSGRVGATERWTRDEFRRRKFCWQDGHPASIVMELWYRGELAERERIEHERDGEGLVRVRWTTEVSREPEEVGRSWVGWYRRSPKAVRAARRLVDEQLPLRILEWVARAAPDETVYALGLLWSIDAPPELPPWLALGTVSDLHRWRERHAAGFELRSHVWNPAEWRCIDLRPDELEGDATLQDAYAVLRDDWVLAENDGEPAATLRRCAKRLLAADWPDALRRADAFAVVVMADDLDDNLVAIVRKTVPATVQRAVETTL